MNLATKGLPGIKRWLRIDLEAAAGEQGVDIAQLQSLSGGGDPTQFLTSGSMPPNACVARRWPSMSSSRC
jgi:hypothetical protein